MVTHITRDLDDDGEPVVRVSHGLGEMTWPYSDMLDTHFSVTDKYFTWTGDVGDYWFEFDEIELAIDTVQRRLGIDDLNKDELRTLLEKLIRVKTK